MISYLGVDNLRNGKKQKKMASRDHAHKGFWASKSLIWDIKLKEVQFSRKKYEAFKYTSI